MKLATPQPEKNLETTVLDDPKKGEKVRTGRMLKACLLIPRTYAFSVL